MTLLRQGLRRAGKRCIMIVMKEHYVYILASKRNGTLYVGMTENLRARVRRHKGKATNGFTKNYEVNKLVYFEKCRDKPIASTREKQLKKWNRRWKIRLIEQSNPTWEDLYSKICKD